MDRQFGMLRVPREGEVGEWADEDATEARCELVVEQALALLSPLERTLVERHAETVDVLLDYGAGVDGAGEWDGSDNQTDEGPLNASLRLGLLHVAADLLVHGAGVERRGRVAREDSLMIACRQGLSPLVPLLVARGAAPTQLDARGYSAACFAVMGNRIDLAEALHAAGYAGEAFYRSALFLAASAEAQYFCEETVERLVGCGCLAEARNERTGDTPLLAAARWGRPGAVGALVGAGANVHAFDDAGRTALHFVCARGNLAAGAPEQTAAALLAAGADPNAVDDQGFTCYEYLATADVDEALRDAVYSVMAERAAPLPPVMPGEVHDATCQRTLLRVAATPGAHADLGGREIDIERTLKLKGRDITIRNGTLRLAGAKALGGGEAVVKLSAAEQLMGVSLSRAWGAAREGDLEIGAVDETPGTVPEHALKAATRFNKKREAVAEGGEGAAGAGAGAGVAKWTVEELMAMRFDALKVIHLEEVGEDYRGLRHKKRIVARLYDVWGVDLPE